MPKLPWQIEIGILNEWIGALLPTVMPYEYNSIISHCRPQKYATKDGREIVGQETKRPTWAIEN